jgi:hypothetical protein
MDNPFKFCLEKFKVALISLNGFMPKQEDYINITVGVQMTIEEFLSKIQRDISNFESFDYGIVMNQEGRIVGVIEGGKDVRNHYTGQ